MRRSGGIPITYLLRDEFTTEEAAPLALPRTCEPGPGMWAGVGASWSIVVGGKLRAPGSVVANTHYLIGPVQSRAVGLAMFTQFNRVNSNNYHPSWGFADNNTTFNSTGDWDANILPAAGQQTLILVNTASITGPGYVASTDYETAIILRTTGALFFIKGGAYTEWTLIWVDNISSTSTLYPVIYARDEQADINYCRIEQLPSPFDTDYGSATYYDATPAGNDTATSKANATQYFSWTVGSTETLIIRFRRTDDDNCYRLECNQALGTIKLFKREGGSDTELDAGKTQTWTPATTYRIAIQYVGTGIKTWVGTTSKHSATGQTFNQTATGAKVSGFASATGWEIWDRQYSGSAAAVLSAV